MYRSKDVHAGMKGFFRELGFSKERSYYYRIENDIAYCIGIEHPPSLFRVQFYIIPLYISYDFVVLNYGNELRKWWNGEADMEGFLNYVKTEIIETILPFFDSISTPDALISFLRQDYSVIRTRFRGAWHFQSALQAYTALRINDEEAFFEALRQGRSLLSRAHCYLPSLHQKMFDELDELERLWTAPESEKERFFQNNIAHTLQTCFPHYKPANMRTE